MNSEMNYTVTLQAEPGHEDKAREAAKRAFGHWGASLDVDVETGEDTRLIRFEEWSDEWPAGREPDVYDLDQTPHIEQSWAAQMARLLR
ncbi:MAG: hypothetical protein AAFR28_03550 [Pseudomonadota bacterium]